MSRNLGALTLLDPSVSAWPVMGVLYMYILHVSTPTRHPQGALIGAC
jgi:hypothetical protein